MKICAVDGCETKAVARGWCKTHYTRWNRYGDVTVRKNTAQVGSCRARGCDRPSKTTGLCGAHYRRLALHGDLLEDQPLREPYTHTRVVVSGYVRVKCPGHPGGQHGWVLEHIIVMEGVLQREMLPGENVHHINGIKDDNRPENLELWVVSQPCGQRASDLVAWAREILDRYGDLDAVRA